MNYGELRDLYGLKERQNPKNEHGQYRKVSDSVESGGTTEFLTHAGIAKEVGFKYMPQGSKNETFSELGKRSGKSRVPLAERIETDNTSDIAETTQEGIAKAKECTHADINLDTSDIPEAPKNPHLQEVYHALVLLKH